MGSRHEDAGYSFAPAAPLRIQPCAHCGSPIMARFYPMKANSTRESPSTPDRTRRLALDPRETFPGMKPTDRAVHEEIMHRAYAIWEREGHPENRQLANWLKAEAEIMGWAAEPTEYAENTG